MGFLSKAFGKFNIIGRARRGARDAASHAAAQREEVMNRLKQVKRPGDLVWEAITNDDYEMIEQLKVASETDPEIRQALEATGATALTPGETPLETKMLAAQKLRESQDLQGAQKGSAQAQAQARASMGMRGGLSGAAGERLAKIGMRQQLEAQQGVRSRGAQARADIGEIGEKTRLDQLGRYAQLAGQEQSARTGREQFNIGNAIQQQTQKRQFDLGQYQEKMRAYAAAQTAMANLQAGQQKSGISGAVGGVLGK